MVRCGLVLATMRALTAGALDTQVDPRGPMEYPGMTPLVDKQGVQVKGYTFVNKCREPSPWQAKWIWLGAETSPAVAMFHKEVTLAEAPSRVMAWMSADMKYRLCVNGRLVSRGPVDMGRDYAGGDTRRWFCDCRGLASFFRKGRNVVAAEVFRQWPIGFTVSRGSPGFLFEPTPHGDVAVSWALGEEKLTLDVTIPAGTEAEVTVPTSHFEQPTITLDGRKVEQVVHLPLHLPSGTYCFEVSGK